jgi:hypothetical protein
LSGLNRLMESNSSLLIIGSPAAIQVLKII